jgi:hypothetical protein
MEWTSRNHGKNLRGHARNCTQLDAVSRRPSVWCLCLDPERIPKQWRSTIQGLLLNIHTYTNKQKNKRAIKARLFFLKLLQLLGSCVCMYVCMCVCVAHVSSFLSTGGIKKAPFREQATSSEYVCTRTIRLRVECYQLLSD